jgi:hypothetical protein
MLRAIEDSEALLSFPCGARERVITRKQSHRALFGRQAETPMTGRAWIARSRIGIGRDASVPVLALRFLRSLLWGFCVVHRDDSPAHENDSQKQTKVTKRESQE